jgi:hypothetical protein
MRFSYTYSTLPVSRTPMSSPTTQTGEDVLTEPLVPNEDEGGADAYRIPANCATVSIHVLDAKWV